MKHLLLILLLLALPARAGVDAGVAEADAGVALPTPSTDLPSQAVIRGILTVAPDKVLDVIGGCWLSEKTCLRTGLFEEQCTGEKARLRQNVLDAYRDAWDTTAIVAVVVAVVAFGAGYLSARALDSSP